MRQFYPFNISLDVAKQVLQSNTNHRLADFSRMSTAFTSIDNILNNGSVEYVVNKEGLLLDVSFYKEIKEDILNNAVPTLVNTVLYGNPGEINVQYYLRALGVKAFKSLRISSQFSNKRFHYSTEEEGKSNQKPTTIKTTDYFRHNEDWSYFNIAGGQVSSKAISKHANKPIYEVINDRRLKLIEEGKLSEDSYFNQQLINRYENVDAQWFIEVVSHIVKRDDNPELLLEDIGCRILSNGQLNTVLTAV